MVAVLEENRRKLFDEFQDQIKTREKVFDEIIPQEEKFGINF